MIWIDYLFIYMFLVTLGIVSIKFAGKWSIIYEGMMDEPHYFFFAIGLTLLPVITIPIFFGIGISNLIPTAEDIKKARLQRQDIYSIVRKHLK